MWSFLLLAALSLVALGQTKLVLYSSGLALVEETRILTLAQEGVLELSGFPEDTLWETLTMEGLEVLALRPLPRESWSLAQLVGQEVRVQSRTATFRGVLRAIAPEGLVLATEAGTVVVRDYEWLGAVDTKPGSAPQALLRYRTTPPGERTVRFRFLARGFSWKIAYDAEYTEDQLRIWGKAWIQNASGVDYAGATIVLVAGEVGGPRATGKAVPLALEAAPAEAFEYYRYDLPGLWDIPRGELAIPLVHASFPAKRLYRLSGSGVEVRLLFAPDTVLPGGEMRVYAEGIFVGASTLPHAPKGKDVELRVGTAFDLWGERVLVERERLGEHLFRETWRIALRSAKKEDVEVEVIETLYGYWRIVRSTLPYEVLDAQRIKFRVPVAGEDATIVEYTVEWRS